MTDRMPSRRELEEQARVSGHVDQAMTLQRSRRLYGSGRRFDQDSAATRPIVEEVRGIV